jgi:hypothetical protein
VNTKLEFNLTHSFHGGKRFIGFLRAGAGRIRIKCNLNPSRLVLRFFHPILLSASEGSKRKKYAS